MASMHMAIIMIMIIDSLAEVRALDLLHGHSQDAADSVDDALQSSTQVLHVRPSVDPMIGVKIPLKSVGLVPLPRLTGQRARFVGLAVTPLNSGRITGAAWPRLTKRREHPRPCDRG